MFYHDSTLLAKKDCLLRTFEKYVRNFCSNFGQS